MAGPSALHCLKAPDMSHKHIISGLFDTYDAAASTVRALEAAGLDHTHLTLVTNHPGVHDSYRLDVAEHTAELGKEELADAVQEVVPGAALGGTVGLLAGLGLIAIPGIGPVLAGGWLVTTAMGVVFGGAGGLTGSLIHAGHIDKHAEAYNEAVRNGGTLVVVRCNDEQIATVRTLLTAEGSRALPLEDR